MAYSTVRSAAERIAVAGASVRSRVHAGKRLWGLWSLMQCCVHTTRRPKDHRSLDVLTASL